MKEIRNALEKFAERASNPATRSILALAGRPDGTLYLPGRNDMIFARGLNGVEYKVICAQPVSFGNYVIIGFAKHDRQHLRVLDVFDSAATAPGTQAIEWQFWYRQVLEWRPDFVGLTMTIRRSALRLLSGAYIYRRTDTLDLTSYIPASGARFALVEVSLVDGNLNIVPGSVVASVSALTSANIPARSSNAAAIGAVCLYAGMSKVTISETRSDWVDLRLSEFGGSSSGGLSLPANKIIATDGSGTPDANSPVWNNGQIRWSELAYTFPGSSVVGWRIAAEDSTPGIELIRAKNTNLAGAINFMKFGGTLAAPTAVQSGWRLGSFSFGGHYGSGVDSVKARIAAEASENWADANRGAKVTISATPNGSATMETIAEFGGTIDLKKSSVGITPSLTATGTEIVTAEWVKKSTVFLLPFSSYASLGSPISASPAYPYAATMPSFVIYPMRWSQGFFVGAVNNASNYWTFDLLASAGGSDVVVATITTVGLAPSSAAIKSTTTFSVSSLNQGNIRLAVRATKTGSPSNISAHGPAFEYTLA